MLLLQDKTDFLRRLSGCCAGSASGDSLKTRDTILSAMLLRFFNHRRVAWGSLFTRTLDYLFKERLRDELLWAKWIKTKRRHYKHPPVPQRAMSTIRPHQWNEPSGAIGRDVKKADQYLGSQISYWIPMVWCVIDGSSCGVARRVFLIFCLAEDFAFIFNKKKYWKSFHVCRFWNARK